MKNDLSNKQLRRFFVQNSLAFALIFLALGMIIMFFLNQTAYSDIDRQLKTLTSADGFAIVQSAEDGQVMIIPNRPSEQNQGQPTGFGQIGFQTQVIFWTDNQTQITLNPLDFRQNITSTIKFDDLHLGRIQDLALVDTYGETMYFRSMTIPFHNSVNNQIAYLQVISNTNQVRTSVLSFQRLVITCMIIFWLLSLLVSFFLAKMAINPLLIAWTKQQEFVENASHELRTPLAIIQNKLETLFTRPDESIMDNSEAIADSLGEIRRLRNLTNDLLTLARRDGNELEVKKEKVNLQEFINKLVVDYADLASLEEKELTYQAVNSDKEVLLDPKLVQQLLVILIDNAIKFTYEKDTIQIVSSIHKQEIELLVKDSGIGISSDKKKAIFERFTRVDNSRNKETGGFGLGLSIAAQIVESMHGKISVADNSPKGTVFKITFPQ